MPDTKTTAFSNINQPICMSCNQPIEEQDPWIEVTYHPSLHSRNYNNFINRQHIECALIHNTVSQTRLDAFMVDYNANKTK